MKRQLKKQDFLSLFRKEAEGHIQELNKGLLQLENDPNNRAALEEVRRRAHTLKGSARMMGFTEISDAAHAMEDLLESVRMELSELDKGVFDRLFHDLDSISALLQDGQESEEARQQRAEGKSEPLPTADAEAGDVESKLKPAPQLDREVRPVTTAVASAILVKTDKLDSLAGIVSEIVLDQIKSENQTTQISQIAKLVKEQVKLWSQIKARLSDSGSPSTRKESKETSYSSRGMGDSPHVKYSQSNEADIKDYDDLSTSMEQTLRSVTNLLNEYKEITTRRRLIIGELQDDIRTMRLIPISAVFDTFPRAIRDLSREYNKEIDPKISGGEVELDKTIIETIKDPLMHLVRNAVDHGIEEPEERIRRGKPKTGNISLSAYHQGSKVVIEVADDGAGIDLEKVKQKALIKGYIQESQMETMDEESAIQLIFLSGLSTSSIITDVSGRGVGMDVVMENISRKLKGTVNVHTEEGRGTRISLAVPITLAVTRGLLVRVGQDMFAIPTESIEKNVQLPRDQIRSVDGKQVMVDGDRIIPLVQLSGVLGLESSTFMEDNGDSSRGMGDFPHKIPVVIVDHSQKQIGFCVNGFAGEQEMVIKNLGSYLTKVSSVAGATILGNGDVVVILHVSDLVNSARNRLAARLIYDPRSALRSQITDHESRITDHESRITDHESRITDHERLPSILIVDDSLTTRELEKGILEASGYNVHVAVDGLDGLSKVSERRIDLIISDVQMPRMNGFQMVQKLKQSDQYKDIPVIMVTALERDEEKRRGIEVGASAYIVKSSFDQSNLLDIIQMLIG
jgi:two-component system chemotaxis sensor kinase CheA